MKYLSVAVPVQNNPGQGPLIMAEKYKITSSSRVTEIIWSDTVSPCSVVMCLSQCARLAECQAVNVIHVHQGTACQCQYSNVRGVIPPQFLQSDAHATLYQQVI